MGNVNASPLAFSFVLADWEWKGEKRGGPSLSPSPALTPRKTAAQREAEKGSRNRM